MALVSHMLQIGTIIIGCSYLFHVVAFSTPYWCKNGSVHDEIWESCDPDDPKDVNTIDNVQMVDFTAFVLYSFGVVCIILKMTCQKERESLYPYACIGVILGAVFHMIALIVYTTLDNFQWSTIQFGVVCVIMASIGGIIGSVFLFLGYRRVEQYSEI